MTRIILILLLFAAAALALAAVMSLFGSGGRVPAGTGLKEDTMPQTFRTIAYVLLFLLMVGVTTGLMGGL